MITKQIFIFDVDGTLTPSRQKIDKKFGDWFLDFCRHFEVHLVTGSDYKKTVQQLGKEICETVNTCFNCSGNDIWRRGENIQTNEFEIPSELLDFLVYRMRSTVFDDFAGKHFEFRPGSMNFSIVGRKANWLHRQKYIAHDEIFHERANIVNEINFRFNDIQASIGGETGIDIYPIGNDKSQVIKHFEPSDIPNISFFGDRMDYEGNDYPLAQTVIDLGGHAYQVNHWKTTFAKLLEIMEEAV